jgi:hemerythrin-like domain-containing protein
LQHRQMPSLLIARVDAIFAKLVLSVRVHRLDTVLFSNKSFQRANGDRSVDASATASGFTRRRADAATDRSEGIWRAGDEVRLFVFAFRDQLNIFAGVSVNGTSRLTWNHALPKLNVWDQSLIFRHSLDLEGIDENHDPHSNNRSSVRHCHKEAHKAQEVFPSFLCILCPFVALFHKALNTLGGISCLRNSPHAVVKNAQISSIPILKSPFFAGAHYLPKVTIRVGAKQLMPLKIGQKLDHGFRNPLGLLSDCHRRIERFLAELILISEEVQGNTLNDLQRHQFEVALRYFREAAPKHTLDEEESLFPRLRAHADSENQPPLLLLDSLNADHREAEDKHRMVDDLGRAWLSHGSLSPNDAQALTTTLRELRTSYEKHIAIEDNQLFPLAERFLDHVELEAVGREMAARRGLAF